MQTSSTTEVASSEAVGGTGGAGAVGEEVDGVLDGERGHGPDRLAAEPEGLAARRQHTQQRAVHEQLLDHAGRLADDVLAVVHDHDGRPVGEVLDQSVEAGRRVTLEGPGLPEPDADRHRVGDRGRVAHGSELHEERIVLELAPGQLLRQPRLPGAPRPDDRHEPVGRHQATEGREIVLPPDEAAEAHRDVGPAAGRSGRVALGGRSRRGILAEDGAFERLQLRAGIEAQLLAEHLAGRLEGPQGLRLPARSGRARTSGGRGVARAAVPRPRAARAPRPARHLARLAARRRCGPRAPSTGARRAGPPPAGAAPRRRSRRGAVPARAPRHRAAPRPRPRRLPPPAPLGPAPPRASKQRASISSSGTSRRYPPAAGDERVAQRAEGPAQLRHERLQGVGAAGRQVIAPELVGQALGLDRLARPHEEEEQQRALLRAPDGQIDVAIDDLELAEHPERHKRTLRPPGRREPGLPSGQRRIRAPSGPRSTLGA